MVCAMYHNIDLVMHIYRKFIYSLRSTKLGKKNMINIEILLDPSVHLVAVMTFTMLTRISLMLECCG